MQDIKGKRLLIIGGVKLACNIIEKARELGVYTIVTDYLEDSPAKKMADESYMISTTDVDAIVDLVREKKIDGVLTGYIDSMLIYCQQVCEKLGYPFYATREQIELTCDKRKFKQICRNNNLQVITEYDPHEGLDNIEYPVVVKPVDSSGSKGISICRNVNELRTGIDKALEFSKSKNVIVEKYMTSEEVVIYYTIQDGTISLSGMCDRYTNKEQPGFAQLPTAYIFPSKYLGSFQKTDDENVKNMLKSICIKNGVLFIQAFIEDGRVCIYEMGYRLNGAQEYRIISAINGINTMEMLIRHALTGKMDGWDLTKYDNPNFSKYACKITPLLRQGVIKKIIGIEEISRLPEIIDIVPVHTEGDRIEAVGTLDQVLTRIFAVSDSIARLQRVIDKVYTTIKVYDDNGNDMLLSGYDVSLLNDRG